MVRISGLEFFSGKIVKIYFSGNKTRIFNYGLEKILDENAKEIIETRGSLYHRVRINGEQLGWVDENRSTVPTAIEQKLNQIVNKLLKSNKN